MRRAPCRHLRQRLQRGIAMIEAVVAVCLLGIGLIGAMAMQARSASALADSAVRVEATMAAGRLLSVMNVDDFDSLEDYAFDGTNAAAEPSDRLLPWYTQTRAAVPNAQIVVGVSKDDVPGSVHVNIRIAWTRKTGAATNAYAVDSYWSKP